MINAAKALFHATLVAALACLVLYAGSCAHVPKPVVDFGICLRKDVSPQVQGIIAAVETDLASGDFVGLLTSLGAKVGYDVVDCAVHEVLGRARARYAAAPSDTLSATEAVRAGQWLGR